MAIDNTPHDSGDERMAMPSGSDVANGAALAVWGPDPGAIPPDARARDADPVAQGIDKSVAAIGIPAETVDGARKWFAGDVNFTPQQLHEFDTTQRLETETELRDLWGADYESNVSRIKRLVGTLPQGSDEALLNGRDATGRALANDPATMQRLLGAANIRGSFDLANGDAASKIAAIERHMRENRAAYNKDELLQETYRQLLAAREGGT